VGGLFDLPPLFARCRPRVEMGRKFQVRRQGGGGQQQIELPGKRRCRRPGRAGPGRVGVGERGNPIQP